MKTDKFSRGLYGLKVRFALMPLLLGGCCVILFFVLNFSIGKYLEKYCNTDEFQQQTTMSYVESLQSYVTKNKLGLGDVEQIISWAKKQPMVYIEMYVNKSCVYSTVYDTAFWNALDSGTDDSFSEELADPGEGEYTWEADPNGQNFLIQAPQIAEDMYEDEYMGGLSQIYLEDWEQSYPLVLKDGKMDVVMYLNLTSRYKNAAVVLEVVLCTLLYVFLFTRLNRKMIRYICLLRDQVKILEGGDLDFQISVEGHDELTELAAGMDAMRLAFREQVAQENAAHEANKKLITEMSHDLRTPLTSLLLYTEIVKFKKYQSEEQLMDYLTKIETKANQIKQLSDNLFSYSLSEKERKNNEIQRNTLESFFGKSIRDGMEDLEKEGFSFECNMNWESDYVSFRQDYADRIINNIFSNIRKYAEKQVPVHVETTKEDTCLGIMFVNIIRMVDRDTQESNGIGLKSVQSMVEQMGGSCMVEQSDIGFSIMFTLPML